MRTNSYLTFPIHLLKFHSEERKKTHDNIEEAIKTGIEYFIRRTKWNYEDVVRQVCYDFLRNRDSLRPQLDSALIDMSEDEELDLFDDNEAFHEDEFYPEEAMNQLKAKMKGDGYF